MADLLAELNSHLGESSYDSPLRTVGDWKIFIDEDGFLPSASNVLLVGKVLAINKSKDYLYAACIGNEGANSVVKIAKGGLLPPGFVDDCKITPLYYIQEGASGIKREALDALHRLSAHVQIVEGMN